MADKNLFNRSPEQYSVQNIQPKVVAFRHLTLGSPTNNYSVHYLNLLCPSMEEKVAFLACYEKTYPDDKAMISVLEKWIDGAFLDYYNGMVLAESINYLSSVYDEASSEKQTELAAEESKDAAQPYAEAGYALSDDLGNVLSENYDLSESLSGSAPSTNEYNFAEREPIAKQKPERVVRSGFLGLRKGTVSHLSPEELRAAMPHRAEKISPDKSREEFLLEKYNKRLAERRAQRERFGNEKSYHKEDAVMSLY